MDKNFKETDFFGKTIDFPNVALLFGGKGYEHSVSKVGAANFLKTAKELGIAILPVYIDKEGSFFIYDGEISDIEKSEKELPKKNLKPTFPVRYLGKSGFLYGDGIISIKRAIPLLHGDYGEDGKIQGLLECASISFFGEGTTTGAITSDKAYSKIIAKHVGVKTLPHLLFEKERASVGEIVKAAEEKFGYPIFIKPTNLGSSIGASMVKCKSEFAKSIEEAFLASDRILVEPALLDKREIECAYYSAGKRKIISAPGEVLTGGVFYDYELKYSEGRAFSAVPNASLTEEVRKTVTEYTEILANAFSVKSIARFDFFVTPDGNVYFNEVNTFPGMTKTSLYSMMLKAEGIDFKAFVYEACYTE